MTAGETAQQRDLETPEHLLPSHSDPSGWVPQTQRTVFWIRASLITEAQRGREKGLKRREKGEIGGKEKARKGWVPALPPVSISDPSILPFILSLHPAPPPPSQQLASFYPSRERPLWWHRLRHQCVQTENRVSKLSINSHPPSPLSISSLVCLAPFLLSPWSPYLLRYPLSLFLSHQPPLPSLLFPSLTPAVTPVSGLYGPAFQSSFNWFGVTYRWDDRSNPPGEVIHIWNASMESIESTMVGCRVINARDFLRLIYFMNTFCEYKLSVLFQKWGHVHHVRYIGFERSCE